MKETYYKHPHLNLSTGVIKRIELLDILEYVDVQNYLQSFFIENQSLNETFYGENKCTNYLYLMKTIFSEYKQYLQHSKNILINSEKPIQFFLRQSTKQMPPKMKLRS